MLDADTHYFALLLPLLAACAPPPDNVASPPPRSSPPTTAEAQAVIDFWRAAGPDLWFAKDADFDRSFRERFAAAHAAAARGELARWAQTADGALALILLLDQYPRNAFRGTAQMYATDGLARTEAERALAAGFDQAVAPELRAFVILPFGHAESLADQERSVELSRCLGAPHLGHAQHHRDIVRRFGRFPHRNAVLGRASTEAERSYLENGGYRG